MGTGHYEGGQATEGMEWREVVKDEMVVELVSQVVEWVVDEWAWW